MSLVTQPAPNFSLPAVPGDSSESRRVSLADYRSRWLLVVFYPRDFSFVCPTELSSFSERIDDFAKRDCDLLGISADSLDSHREWLGATPAQGGIGALRFPLASDVDGQVAHAFGVWVPERKVATRGLFLIDRDQLVQYAVIHNLSVGRNVDEILRVLDALQSGGLCPANWTRADGTIDLERALRPGRVLGHYRIQERIGDGTFGSVFAACDLWLERRVALKVLKRTGAASRGAVLREARAAASLNHPHVCAIYAVEEHDGLSVIAMEYVDGRPLDEALAPRLDFGERMQLARDIAAGLAAAHARGIIHGDLKPANILVTAELQPKTLDFGLARRFDPLDDEHPEPLMAPSVEPARGGPSAETPPANSLRPLAEVATVDATLSASHPATSSVSTGRSLRGTPAFMAPEQWRGEPASTASDVFAFGLVLYQIATGRRAIPHGSLAEILAQIESPDFARQRAAEVPGPLQSLVAAALAPNPSARPSLDELLDRLSTE